MSKDYCKKFNVESVPTTDPEMRIYCQRPGKKDKDGKPLYFTEQSHKKECDVNMIIKKYDKTGLINHIQTIEGKFGDVSGIEFQAMQERVASAKSSFAALPTEIRQRFKNDPAELLKFMDDPNNREEGIELGLIHAETPLDLDGFGEHVSEENAFDPKKEEADQDE